MSNPQEMKNWIKLFEAKDDKELLTEAHYGPDIAAKKGSEKHEFASVVVRRQFGKPEIKFHATNDDAREEGDETSAYHSAVYKRKGSKWVRTHSATEPDDDGGYGSY